MKLRLYFFYGLVVLCFISCSHKEKDLLISADVIEFDSFPKEIRKTAHPTGISVMGVIGLEIYENMLMAFTVNPAALISIVDLDTGETLWEGGLLGRGPDEFLSRFSTQSQFEARNGHICLWTFVREARRGVLIDITESIAKQKTVICESWLLKAEYAQRDGMLILPNGERFVKFPLTYDDPRDAIFYYPKYLYFSSDDREIRELDFFKRGRCSLPPLSDRMAIHQLLFDGTLKLKPDGTKAIDAFTYADHLNFLDLVKNSGFSMKYSKGIPLADLAKISRSDLNQSKLGSYKNVTVTDDYVLALFSEKQALKEGEVDRYTTSAIRIFDWDGNPLSLVHVDKELSSIAYDQRTKRVYALDFEENIMYYELDDVI